jgi:DNA-binding NtrC family response regulator
MPYLELFRDGDHSARFPLKRAETRIGRGSGCDVVLPADYVSRVHCVLRQRGRQYELLDRSSNGTFVNGQRGERFMLDPGDRIDIGDWALVLQDEEASPVEATARRDLVAPGTVLFYDPADRSVTIDGLQLVVREGVRRGEGFAIDRPLVRIGSGEGCDWRLDVPGLEAEHVEIRSDAGGVRARDLGTRRGSWLDGQPLKDERTLAPGGVLRLGSVELHVERHRRQQPVSPSTEQRFEDLVGASPRMLEVFGLLRQLADQKVEVLITGETGTGKELVARALHHASSRAGAPFVVLNCGALPETLVESELFGHVRGAFTGATDNKEGAFRAADGGTLFLDEIGELPLPMQTRLLRALENGEVVPVGSQKVHRPDVRIVAATHRDLASDVAEGLFRRDLFFRLFVAVVKLPALRERREDIPLLVEHILAQISPGATISLTPDARRLLRDHHWEGNVRSLKNTLLRAVTTRRSNLIRADDLVFPPSTQAGMERLRWPTTGSPICAEEEELSRWDRALRRVIVEVMEECGGSKRRAAPTLGIARSTLYDRIDQFKIDL